MARAACEARRVVPGVGFGWSVPVFRRCGCLLLACLGPADRSSPAGGSRCCSSLRLAPHRGLGAGPGV